MAESWPTIRDFLGMPPGLDGRGVCVAIVDSAFPAHPDICCNAWRRTLLVHTSCVRPRPRALRPSAGPWPDGAHGLWSAAAAAGSGQLSRGLYTGMAPRADLLLLAATDASAPWDSRRDVGRALGWLCRHWRQYGVRAVLVANAGERDTGLLPWQLDPLRVLCERLSAQGLLVIAGTGNTTDLTCQVTEAAAPSTLAVGGVVVPQSGRASDAMPYHGSRGTTFEGKWVPQVLAPAENVVLPWGDQALLREHPYASTDRLSPGYARTEGTSFAGPIVLGAVACLWQVRPDLSGPRVASALANAALFAGPRSELHAGLVSVGEALGALRDGLPLPGGDEPYSQWTALLRCGAGARLLQASRAQGATAADALLSLVSTGLSPRQVSVVAGCLDHDDAHARAAAVYALSGPGRSATQPELLAAVRDPSPLVRNAAACALGQPVASGGARGELLGLALDDPSMDVRFCAIEAAGRSGEVAFVPAIARGLHEDANAWRVACFGARLRALERLTRVAFAWEPAWRHGECWYSEASRTARLSIADRWVDWVQQAR